MQAFFFGTSCEGSSLQVLHYRKLLRFKHEAGTDAAPWPEYTPYTLLQTGASISRLRFGVRKNYSDVDKIPNTSPNVHRHNTACEPYANSNFGSPGRNLSKSCLKSHNMLHLWSEVPPGETRGASGRTLQRYLGVRKSRGLGFKL